MIQKVFLILMVISSLISSEIKRDDKMRVFVLADQFGTYHTVDRHIKRILVSSQKDISAQMNNFLASKPADYLEKRGAVYIANISKMPSLITKYIAIPKLKKYKHTILLLNDESDERFKTKDEKITLYILKNSIVQDILFLDSVQKLKKYL